MDVMLFAEEWVTCVPEPILVHMMLRKVKPLEFCSQLAGVSLAVSLLAVSRDYLSLH